MAEVKIAADSGGGSVGLVGPASTTSNAAVQFKLPVADGSASQVLKTDGSGNLSWYTLLDNSPAFAAYQREPDFGGNQTVQNDTWTALTPSQEEYDTDSAYNTSTGEFVVPANKGGKFHFNGFARSGGIDAGEQMSLKLYKDTGSGYSAIEWTETISFEDSTTHGSHGHSMHATLSLNAGDKIKLYGWHNEGDWQYFSIMRFSGYRLVL